MDKKAYIVFESDGMGDDWTSVAVFLDEQKCDEFIREKNMAWDRDIELRTECEKCRHSDMYFGEETDDDVFLLKDICKRASIGTDRYGLYCVNDMSDGYNVMSMYYSKVAVKLFE